MEDNFFRILDANINRATEGIRVCEDVLRFFFNDIKLSEKTKKLRHEIIDILNSGFVKRDDLIKKRNIETDGLKDVSIITELKRKDVHEIFQANIKRVEESLRVIEEVVKLKDIKLSKKFKSLRFSSYKLEKDYIDRWI